MSATTATSGRMHRAARALLMMGVLAAAPPLAAQVSVPADTPTTSTLRVVNDRATIWSRNPSLVLAVVRRDTLLRAVSREEQWFEVVVPGTDGRAETTGFVYAGHVELVPGTPMPPMRQPPAQASRASGRAGAAPPALGIRGFGSFSYMFFQASDSFDAIFGEASQPLYGGGGEVVFGDRLFVRGEVERFRKTGERVIVFEDEVFPLGLSNTVTITPVTFTGGYRFRSTTAMVPYVGGGVGVYRFREESEFSEPDEQVDDSFTSYHALAGVEYAVSRWLFTAFEVRYTTVPDSLGAPGVSGDFNESNLGGFSVGVKLMIGR
jgi:outer membrane protein W